MPKWDTHKKHGGQPHAKRNMWNGRKKGEWYVDKKCRHLINEHKYIF